MAKTKTGIEAETPGRQEAAPATEAADDTPETEAETRADAQAEGDAQPEDRSESEGADRPEDGPGSGSAAAAEDDDAAKGDDRPEDGAEAEDDVAEDDAEPRGGDAAEGGSGAKAGAETKSAARRKAEGREPARRKAGAREPVRTSDPLLTTATVLVVLAAIWAVWAGWSWYAAAHDDSLHYSQLRDEVLRSGEQGIQNLNTLDYRDLDRGLRTWQDSSTSELYQQIVQGREQFEADVLKAKTVTSAKVLDAAVTELDDHAGKASVIAAVQITVALPDERPATKQTRLIGQLTRTATGWKLSSLGQAPAGASGS